VPRFIYVDGPRKGLVDFRNLLPGEIPIREGLYRLTNRITSDGIVEYRWKQLVTSPPAKRKTKPKKSRASSPKT
jgi:hypothetical protein